MDQIDREIIQILKNNAKTRIYIIAKKLGIPPSTAHHRIKKLEKKGLKWTVEPNYAEMGLPIKAFVLVNFDVTELKRLGKTQEQIAKKLKKLENVEKIDIITGEADMLITIRAETMQHLQKIILEKIQEIEGISGTRTIISLSEH